MSAEQILGLTVALLVMLFGCLGSLLPVLPGTPLVLIAAIAHRLYFGAESASNWVLAGLILLTLLSIAFDYVAGSFGAKKLGATWRGMLGAAIGGLVGLFFSLPGIILGPFLGALLFELVGGHQFRKASLAGVGAMLGLLAGALGKFAICVAMICLFAANVIYRSMA